jgi:hypothetical protein
MFFVAVPEKYAGKNRIHVPENLFYPVNLLDDMLYLGYHGSAIKYNIVDKASGSMFRCSVRFSADKILFLRYSNITKACKLWECSEHFFL